jgi:hypothetical protein
MPKAAEDTPLTRAIRAYLTASGESMRSLSLKVGSNETLVRKILAGDSRNSRGDTLRRFAEVIGVDVASLTDDEAPAPAPNVAPAPGLVVPAFATLPLDLPVYGTAAGSNGDGAFIFSTHDVVDRVRRPASLAANKVAYGLYVEGDSMEPQLYAGELIIADPAKKPRPRDRVVLVIARPDGEAHESMAYVKELVRITADKVIVRQFNPARDLEFPKASVASMHRVLTTAELFGA